MGVEKQMAHLIMENDKTYYIGWDVGAWNCDKNSRSRDAVAILNSDRKIIGKPFRGNLKELINASKNKTEFINGLFEKCDNPNITSKKIVLAIDAPLAFSVGLTNLITGKISGNINDHQNNPYLFRATERFLFENGFKPLSSIKDMIGSQATKAMHVIAKFKLKIVDCGVWQDNSGLLKVIETYPAVCKRIRLSAEAKNLKTQDRKDAWICAEVAYLFHKKKRGATWPS